jgi:hypothetical protein
MPSRDDNKRRLTSHEIATLHVRRAKLVPALHAYVETIDRPFWWIAAEIGVATSASKLAKRKDKTAIRVPGPYRSILKTTKVPGPQQFGNPERIQALLP